MVTKSPVFWDGEAWGPSGEPSKRIPTGGGVETLRGLNVNSNTVRQRFQREVELAARLEHPNIAQVYESGMINGHYYYALQLIDGVPLDALCREFGGQ
ncbi:MAG: hypothetical protein R3F31_26590 [Verrucomicrobiales bacterium]